MMEKIRKITDRLCFFSQGAKLTKQCRSAATTVDEKERCGSWNRTFYLDSIEQGGGLSALKVR